VVVGLVKGVPEDGPEIAARWQRAIVLAKEFLAAINIFDITNNSSLFVRRETIE